MNQFNALMLLIVLLINPLTSIAENKWILEKNVNGVKVFTRQSSESTFKEFKGIAQFKTSLNSIVSLLEDTASCKEWVYRCIKEKLLKRINSSESYKYSVSDGSPFSDNRDSIVHIIRYQDPKTKIVTFKRTGTPDYIPRESNIVRVTMIQGFWKLTPKQNGMVEVIFQTDSEPGGYIPSFLANVMVTNPPYETLSSMKRMLRMPKYSNAKRLVEELKEGK